ncbi:unnamed protein product, partial [Pylaiella littoralis]
VGDDRWASANVRGFLKSPNGCVSGVLGLRGHDDVLWSRRCRGVATNVDGSLGVARCSECKDFYRRSVTRRTIQAAKHTPDRSTRIGDMSTGQKERTIHLINRDRKKKAAEIARLREELHVARKDFVKFNKKQGEALHELFMDPKSKEVLCTKLPKDSAERAIYEDQVRWNSTHGAAKGFRFHPTTLRIAIY